MPSFTTRTLFTLTPGKSSRGWCIFGVVIIVVAVIALLASAAHCAIKKHKARRSRVYWRDFEMAHNVTVNRPTQAQTIPERNGSTGKELDKQHEVEAEQRDAGLSSGPSDAKMVAGSGPESPRKRIT